MVIGRIYKIVSGQGNECYVGSTFNELKYRFRQHKDDYREWKKDKKRGCSSSCEIFDKYEKNNCRMLLIKEYEVEDREHLKVYEQLWINKLKPINKLSSFVIEPVLKKKLAEYKKKWYQDKLKENPNYNQEKYQKLIVNYQKYREKQNQQKREKITCEICDCEITRGGKSSHEKTKKHQNNLNNLQQ